uniref:Transposase n=1 Tax=Heterorhabditis bacteriophora TaxID=37862 RepID=A0A1I7W8C5_HETBA
MPDLSKGVRTTDRSAPVAQLTLPGDDQSIACAEWAAYFVDFSNDVTASYNRIELG